MSTDNIPLVPGTGKPWLTPNFPAIPEEMRELHQWVLFRIEGEDERKVPYTPAGKRASTKDPETWSSFDEVVTAYVNGGFDGIGFVFTKGDPYCGIDVDDCRNPDTGEIDPWALEIANPIGSYTEASCSGTGIHIITRASVPEGRNVDGIEIYDDGRFFTVTGAHIEGTPATIEDAQVRVTSLYEELTAKLGGPSGKALAVPEDAIDWDADPESIREKLDKIIASDPQFRKTWEHDRPDLADQSLSSYDLSILSQAVLVHECTDPTSLYLLLRLHREEHGDPDKKSKRRDYVRRTIGKALAGVDQEDQNETDTRVVIRIKPGGLAAATRKAAAALGRATHANPFQGIYRYGDVLVQVTRRSGDPKLHRYGGHGACAAPVMIRAEHDALEHVLDETCRFMRYSASKGRWLPKDVPPKVARRLLGKAAKWSEIPVLTGIVEAPMLRADGTVLVQPGYDLQTGLLFDAGGVEFPVLPESPTREDALAALEEFTALLAGFPCIDRASLSVAVAAILTALVRHACRAVPLIAITAPRPASGKTLLATIVSYVLTGRPPRLMSQAESPGEERKRLLAVLLEGASLVVIDNVERELKSDALCTVLTEPFFSDRLLGVSKTVTVPSRATFFATGNNLVLVGDLTARAVVCALDPGCERPEERTFDVNLHEEVPERRAELVVAGLTIVLAYLAAGMPEQEVKNFARFEDWCKFVRYPLIWLDMADPYEGRDRIKGRDPVCEQLIALLTAWHDVFGSDPVKVGDVIKEAGDLNGSTAKIEARRVLYEALAELGGRNGKMSPTAIGKFIASHENRIEAGLRFEKAGKAKGAVLWRVRAMHIDSQTPAIPGDPVTPPSSGEVGEVGEVPYSKGTPMIVKHGKFILKNKKLGTTPVEVEDPVEGSGEHPPQVPGLNLDDLANEPNQVSASGAAGKPVNQPHDPGTQDNPLANDPGDL